MALLFMMALLSVTATLVHSASNKTGCGFTQSNLCIQNSCVISPCSMLCGLTTQYNTLWIKQMRRPEMSCLGQVRSALFAEELWILYLKGAKHCSQACGVANCSSMTCPNSVNRCEQLSARKMTCEANVCTQVCNENGCQMACLA